MWYRAAANTPTVSCSNDTRQSRKSINQMPAETTNFNRNMNQRHSCTNHEAIVGKIGEKTRCVNVNHKMPVIEPTIDPTITWFHVWYCRYVLLRHTSTVIPQHATRTSNRPTRSNGDCPLLLMCNLYGRITIQCIQYLFGGGGYLQILRFGFISEECKQERGSRLNAYTYELTGKSRTT